MQSHLLLDNASVEPAVSTCLKKINEMTAQMQQIDHLKIFTVSWNMGSVSPTADVLDKLFMKNTILHDVYVVAT